MRDFDGKHGLIVGVANRCSIAWAIAQEVTDRGARVALTYQDERLRPNVEELASTLNGASGITGEILMVDAGYHVTGI
jgi:enoyl-[acyl-carrier protein] reductase I